MIFSLSRLYLLSWQSLIINGSLYDDQLFLSLAENISNGNWLGEYNNRTLIKGCFYPLWIAINNLLGIPLLLSQHLLYIASCIFFILSIRLRIENNDLLIIIFLTMLFNPMSISDDSISQMMRSAIYPSLTLLVVSAAIMQIFLFSKQKKINIFLSLLSGLLLSAFWLTREESIWITPFLSLYCGFMLIKLYKMSYSIGFICKQTCILLTPVFILLLSISAVSALNKYYYQTFQVNELKSSYFKSAYGALIRVKHSHPHTAIPVPIEIRDQLYQVSPAFSELKNFLEGEASKTWGATLYHVKQLYLNGKLNKPLTKEVDSLLKNDYSITWKNLWKNVKQGDNNLNGSVFIWAFRDAVTAAGYHSSTEVKSFYVRLANEINQACEDKKIDCLSQRQSLTLPWRMEYLTPLLKTFKGSLLFLVDHYEFNSAVNTENSHKILILKTLCYFYQPFISGCLGLFFLLFLVVSLKYFKQLYLNDYWLISFALLISIFFLLMGLSYIHVSNFPAIIFRYFAPLYPLLIIYSLFVYLTLHSLISTDKKIENNLIG